MNQHEELPYDIIAQVYEVTLRPESGRGLVQRIAALCGCEGIDWRSESKEGDWYDWYRIANEPESGSHMQVRIDTAIARVLAQCSRQNLPSARRILMQLRPHILHADRIAKKLRSLECERDALESIARRRGLVVLLYDERKKLRAILPGDVRLPVSASVAVLGEHGLHIADQKLAWKFDAALSSCINADYPQGPCTMDALSLCDDGTPKKNLRVVIQSWRDCDGASQGVAAMAVLGSDNTLWIDRELLQEVYGLSRVEAAVAMAIVRGHHCDVIARHLCITKHAVLAHTANILAKCNASNQAQLVRILLCSPAAYMFKNGMC
jgi:DNA-binding CsgD family transcriptional regulator